MSQTGAPLVGFYDDRLVALSILIAISASYAALDLGGRVTAARGWIRSAWLAGGATAMGFGIWSMHFTGMLAFDLPVPVAYHWPTVFLSLLTAISASAIAFYVVSRKKMGRVETLTGSLVIGLGIAGMHYIGMAAMRLPAACHYSPLLVAVSVVIAILASMAALVFTFDHREDFRGTTVAKAISAAAMGGAISLMHYTGMMSASFIPSTVFPDMSRAVSVTSLGFSGVVIGTLVVQGVAIWTSAVDRRFAMQAQELQTSERFRQIADNLQIVLALADGDFSQLLYVNHAYRVIWGRTLESVYAEPKSWLEGIHAEDRARVEESLQRLIGGESIDDLECRVVRPDGSTSWVACRGFPIRDAHGHVYRLVSSAQDITGRKQAEDALRQLSGQLLRLQDEERRRIARDLHDATGQNLVALAMMLDQLRGSIPSGNRKSQGLLSECEALAELCVREVRTLSYLLHPPMLEESGLEDAIRDYVNGFTKRSGIRVALELPPGLERMARDVELALFRVVQEALTNIQRHSGIQQAKIRINRNSHLRLEISDLGKGVSGGTPREKQDPPFEVGVGIPSMRERVKLIGGRLDVHFSSHGTTVRVTIPLERSEREKVAHSGG